MLVNSDLVVGVVNTLKDVLNVINSIMGSMNGVPGTIITITVALGVIIGIFKQIRNFFEQQAIQRALLLKQAEEAGVVEQQKVGFFEHQRLKLEAISQKMQEISAIAKTHAKDIQQANNAREDELKKLQRMSSAEKAQWNAKTKK